MNNAEKNYWNRPKNFAAARDYVSSLMDAGKIVEASFFCAKLLEESPNNKYANKLAFLLAIRRMDPNVKAYDDRLANSNMPTQERIVLHCRYYFAFQNYENLKGSVDSILSKEPLDNDALNVVIESLSVLKNYSLTRKFISLYLSKIKLPVHVEKEFKDILLNRLVEIISSRQGQIHG